MPINLPGMGLNEWFGLAKETTYGTPVLTPTEWFRTLSFRGGRKQPAMEAAGPTGTPTDLVTTRSFKGTQRISFQVSTLLGYEDIERILPNLTGGYVYSAGSPSIHTGTISGSALPTAMPYSLTVIRNTNIEQFAYAGCVIRSATFSGGADRIATLELDIVAQSGGNVDVTPLGSPAFHAGPWVEHPHLTVRWNDTPGQSKGAATVQSGGAGIGEWSVKVTNPLREEPIAGANTIREPIWNGFRTAEITLSREYFDNTFFTSFHKASTTAARLEWFDTLELIFDSGIVAATGNYLLNFYAPYVTLKDNTQDMSDVSQIPETLTFKCGTNGTAGVLAIQFENANAISMA